MLFIMTEIEKRRSDLLEQTRNMYQEKKTPPAIHPRYQSAYFSLYKDEFEDSRVGTNTFLIRSLIAFFVFVLFFVIDRRQETIGNVDSETIVAAVCDDLFSQ